MTVTAMTSETLTIAPRPLKIELRSPAFRAVAGHSKHNEAQREQTQSCDPKGEDFRIEYVVGINRVQPTFLASLLVPQIKLKWPVRRMPP